MFPSHTYCRHFYSFAIDSKLFHENVTLPYACDNHLLHPSKGRSQLCVPFACQGSEQTPRTGQESEKRSPGCWLPATETGTGTKGQGRLLSAKATRGSSDVGGSGAEGVSVCPTIITLGSCSMAVETRQSPLRTCQATGPSEAVQ